MSSTDKINLTTTSFPRLEGLEKGTLSCRTISSGEPIGIGIYYEPFHDYDPIYLYISKDTPYGKALLKLWELGKGDVTGENIAEIVDAYGGLDKILIDFEIGRASCRERV